MIWYANDSKRRRKDSLADVQHLLFRRVISLRRFWFTLIGNNNIITHIKDNKNQKLEL